MRIGAVLAAPSPPAPGTVVADLGGDVELSHVNLTLGAKTVLKDISFSVKAGTRTAVIGPTAAGKTQLLYLLTGLQAPTSGTVAYDGRPIQEYEKTSLHQQVAFVFQDATMFNLTVRENIGFSKSVKDEDLAKAIATAELTDFVERCRRGLPWWPSARPVGRPAAPDARAGAGAQSRCCSASRRGAWMIPAPDSGERAAPLSEADARVRDAEDRAGRGLRSDHPDHGRGSARLGHASPIARDVP